MLSLMEFLRHRNELLFHFGTLSLLAALACLVLVLTTHGQVSGVNAFVKPLKFFVSVGIFAWTMGLYVPYLDSPAVVRWYSWATVLALGYELVVITLQAARGRMSHFNIETPLDSAIFQSMGIVIVVQTLWTGYIGYRFFVQPEFALTPTLVWAIRLGIAMAVLFAFQGGYMGAVLRHSVGGPDGGGAGLPLVNWSRQYGDLRVAHFFGLHALQAVPLLAYLIARSPAHVFVIAGVYFAFVTFTFVQALSGRPL